MASESTQFGHDVLSAQETDSDLQGLKEVQQLQQDDLLQEWELVLANKIIKEEDSSHTVLVHNNVTGSFKTKLETSHTPKVELLPRMQFCEQLTSRQAKQEDVHAKDTCVTLTKELKQNLDNQDNLNSDLAEEDFSSDALRLDVDHDKPQVVEEELRSGSDRLSSNLETGDEINMCLQTSEESLMTELVKERSWRLQLSDQLERLKYAHQQALETVEQSSRVTEAICWELKALKEDYQQLGIRLQVEKDLRCKAQALTDRLSLSLEKENKNNESLRRERESLSTELEIEHNRRLELKDQLEKQKVAHQEVLETHHELDTLKKINLGLSTKLQKEEELRSQGLMKRPSMNLEGEETSDRCLSEEESLSIELEKEQSWKVQLETQEAAHQETLVAVKEALHQELEDLNEANKQLFTQLKAEEQQRSKSEAFTTRLSHNLETELRKNESLTKEKEFLIIELEKERTCRLHLSDELQNQRNSHRQEMESLKESTSEKLQSLERLNCELNHVIRTEKDVNATLKRDFHKVSVALDGQVKKNSNLSKLRDFDKAEFQKEQMCRLNLQNQLEKQKLDQHQALEAVKQSSKVTEALRLELDALKEGNMRLASTLQIEKEHRCINKALTEKLSNTLEMEAKKNEVITKEKEFLFVELEKEHNWRLQLSKKMEKQKLTHKQALETFKQFRALADSLCQELDSLRATYQQLSSKVQVEEELKNISQALTNRLANNLEIEANMNESLTKEKLSLSAELEKEQKQRMQLSDQLQRQRLIHQEALEAFNVKLEALEDANEQLSSQLQVQEALVNNCQAESIKLHQELEAEIQKNESLTKDKDCLTARLADEQTLRVQLDEQVQEQKDALMEAEANTKSADEKVRCLEKLNSELSHSISAERDVNGTLRGDTFRLSFALQTQITKNEYLSKQREYDAEKIQKEQGWRLQLEDQLEAQKLTHQQVLDKLKKQNDVTEDLCSELKVLKETNQCLVNKLQAEEELRHNTQGLNDRLSADLKIEVAKNASLVEVNNSLNNELEKERNFRLQLSDQLDTLKHHHNILVTSKHDTIDSTRRELEALQETHQQLFSRLVVEEEAKYDLQLLTDRLSINLETEMEKNISLTEQIQTLNSRLEEEQLWRQQLHSELENQKLTYDKAVKQSSKVIEVLKLDLNATKGVNKQVAHKFQVEEELRGNTQASNERLSTNLDENPKNEKESLSIELDTSNSDPQENQETKKSISPETKVLGMGLQTLREAHIQIHAKLQGEMDFPGYVPSPIYRLFDNLEKKDKESLRVELEKEKIWRKQSSDELDRQKLAHQQLLETVKQSSDVAEALHLELAALKEANQHLTTKLRAEEELRRLSHALNERLSANLQSEKKSNNSLVSEKEALSAKLEEEQSWRLQLRDDLKKQKECHLQESEALRKSTADKVQRLERMNFDLDYSFRTEKDINTALREDAVRLSIALETQIAKNENLSKWIECDIAELHKEQKRRLELQNQLKQEKVVHQQEIDAYNHSSDALFAKLQVEERLRCDTRALNDKLLVSLKAEIEKNKSLTKEKEFLRTQLEEEQTRRLQLSDQLESHKEVHLHEAESLRQKLDRMEKRNSQLNHSLKTEKNLNSALREDAQRLSSALESKIGSNKTLSQQRDYYINKLQEEQTRRQNLSKEQCWD